MSASESTELQTLEGVTTGRYIITTLSGTQHFLDLDAKTSVRRGAVGHEWGSQMIRGEMGGGGSRPKALVTVGPITPDGAPFHFTSISGVAVGSSMRLDNADEWRITSEIQKIEEWHDV